MPKITSKIRRVRRGIVRRVRDRGAPPRPAQPQAPRPPQPAQPAQPAQAAQAAGAPPAIDYGGAWDDYARTWAQRFPGLAYLGDEWTGQEAGAAGSLEEYVKLIEERFIAPYIESTDTVLEIGVGGGRTAVLLKAYADKLVLADVAETMLDATRNRVGTDGVRYVKLDGIRLDAIARHSVDVTFCFDTLVHVEPRDIFNYLTRIPALMRGKRLVVLHHANMLSDRGFARFLKEWDKSLMGRRHGRSFSVMTDTIMQRFLDHLGYEVIVKDTESIPRDCVWVVRAPEQN